MIIGVAIKLDENGKVYGQPKPARHHNVIHSLALNGFNTPIKGVQGFVNDKGQFLDRYEALVEAVGCDQIDKRDHQAYLFSEDLW